jgi:phage FluMu gp28-like protein
MYPAQLAAVFCAERYAIVEASTKSGKTVSAMCWLAEQALVGQGGGRSYWWVAPILAQAEMVYRRLKRGLPREYYAANETGRTLVLANGAVIAFKGADHPDSLYGEDVYAAVIDEATRVKEEAYHAVRSTLTATRGALRVIGNVKGRRNWAYRLARMAQAGAPDMHYAKITAHDAVAAGVLDRLEVEDARAKLPEAVFRELYLADPTDDMGNPFGAAAIAEAVGPYSVAQPAHWGWDLAKSADWTVGVALDEGGTVCRFERWHKDRLPPGFPALTDYWAATVQRISELGGDTPAYIDSTGVGDPVYEAVSRGRERVRPFHFTLSSKQQLMEGLAVALQQRQVRIPEGTMRAELEAFEYHYSRSGVSYSAPEGLHDDCVCALALAWRAHETLSAARAGVWFI